MKKALARLRAKTDRELGILAEKQLEQTIRLAESGQAAEAAYHCEQARRILAVTNLPEFQRERIAMKLSAIDRLLRLGEEVVTTAVA
jgi:hypothetical protein